MKKQILGRASAILPTTTAALLALLAVTTATHAQTDTTWTRGNSTNNWNQSANWSAGVPVAGFNAIFGASVVAAPNQIITLAMDKITFATGGAAYTAQFQNWNVNVAGTFLEVQSGNTQAQTLAATRSGGGTILLKSGTSTILNNGSNATGLLFGNIAAANSKLTGASGASSTLVVDGSGITTIGIGGTATATNMVISDGSSGGTLSLTKNGTGTLNLNSANTFSGGLTLQGTGAINLSHSNAAGTGTIFLKYASSSFVAKTLGISGGITVANAIQIDSTTGREAIVSSGTGDNSLTGGITITGAGANSILFANDQSSGNLTVSGGISGASYANQLSLRGSQSGNVGFLNGSVTLASGGLFDNNGATSWTLNTAGSTWGQTLVRGSGNLILGANDALATSARVVFDLATSTGGVDLNGYNQTVAGIETAVTPTSGNGGRITNGGSSDSLLTLAGLSTTRTFAGTITDGPTNKVSLVMNSSGRTQTLTGTNTYSGATTISAGTLNISDAGRLGSGNYSGEIINNGSLIYSSYSNQTLSGPISGTGSLTKNGSSTLTLTSANTFSGVTLVNSGTLVISHALALQNSIIESVFSASFELNGVTAPTFGGLQGSRNLANTLGTTGYSSVTGITLNPQTGVSTTYSGVIADGAANMTLTKTGDGTQIFTGANTYTGATRINSGTLQIGAGSTTGSISASSAISNNATLVINRSDAITLSNTISGTGNLTKLGTNTLTLSGASANTFNGTTTVSAGNLVLDKTSGIVAVGGNLVLNGSSQLRYGTNKNEQIADTASITLNGSQSVFNGSTWNATTDAVTVTETIANLTITNGQFNTGSVGNWTITGAGLFDGTVGDSRFVGFSGSRTSFNSLSLIGMNGTTLAVTPDSFAINGDTSTLSTLLVGSGGLFLDGSNLVINRGLANGNVGSRLILDGNITTTGTSSSQILSLAGNNFGTSDISLSSVAGNFTRTITTGSGANLTIALPITNGNATAAGILKDGAGTLFLSGTNTYTGATTISAGTLSIASVNNLGSTSGISLGDTGVLAYTGSAATLNRTISVTSGNGSVLNTGGGLLTLSGTLTKNGTTLRLAGGSGGITVSGAIVGSNANSDLVIDGGSVTLASANSYNGPTALLNGATLTASVVNALPTANGRSAISIDATGTGASTLALGASQSIASLSGAASSNVTLGSNTLTVGTTSGNTTFAGRISGGASSALVKDGASTQVLSGNNNGFTGATTINSGTLTATAAGALGGTTSIDVNGGSFLVRSADAVNDDANITLNGGRLSVSGNFNENVGLLTLSSNSVIDFSGFSGVLRFSGIGSWATGANLAIWNWSGTTYWGTQVNNYATPSNLVFSTVTSTLTSNLNNINFYSDNGITSIGSGFAKSFEQSGFATSTEIIAVPEPETYLAIIFILSVLGFYKLSSLKRKPAAAG